MAVKPKDDVTTQTIVTNPDGSQTVTTVSPKPVDPDAPKTIADYGLSKDFLDSHPQVKEAIDKAIAGGWTQDKFNRYVESKTDFGRNRYAAQEIFDIGIVDPVQGPELQKQISDQRIRVQQEASQLGVSLNSADINNLAERIVRNGLGGVEVRLLIGQKFTTPETGSVTGDASMLTDSLKRIAGDYGITLTASDVEGKIRQGLQSGDSPNAWAESQRNYYRDQAKNLYPTISDQLDKYTVKDILDPYLSTASNLLGIDTKNMNLDDDRWIKPLTGGADGTLMNVNEWRTTLRTEDRYGYGETTQAMNEAADLGNQILSIMGTV